MDLASLEKRKPKPRKGLWSPEEDRKLRDHVLMHGVSCWSSIPISTGLQRNGKSCRLRWINYLRPGLKRGMFTTQEEKMIFSLHRQLGNKWARIAQHLPGRTDNEIKNHWHTNLKKKLAAETKQPSSSSSSSASATAAAAAKLARPQNQLNNDNSDDIKSSAPPKPSSPNLLREGSTPAIDQGPCSFMPKIFFTEWLLSQDDHSDQVMGWCTSTTYGQMGEANSGCNKDGIGCASNSHQDYPLMLVHDHNNFCESDDRSSGGAYVNGEPSSGHEPRAAGGCGDMYGSQLKLEDQLISDIGFFDCFPGDYDALSLFNLGSDVNFMYTL